MSLEEKITKRATRERIQQKLMLILFRMTTRSASLAFAPESYLIKHLALQTKETRQPSYRIRQGLRRLEEKGMVQWQKGHDGWSARLTDKGKKHSERMYNVAQVRITKPAEWDGRWRMVIFDIWERRRNARNKLRGTLQKACFLRVQDSVWIYPYDCEELVAFLRTDLRLGGSVLYVVAEGIEHDEKLRRHFNLP